MELLQCVEPLIACAASVGGTLSGYIAGGVALSATALGFARMFFKPLQPMLAKLSEMTKTDWDNKVVRFVSWFLDYTLSIKVLQKKSDG